MTVGFKGFAKPTKIDDERAKGALSNLPSDEYVLWTGGRYGMRRASGRAACLQTITEKNRPISVQTYVKRCLDMNNGQGFDTQISMGGLGLHQVAKPAVYLLLVKDDKGNFVAKKRIPTPDPDAFPDAYKKGGFNPGDVVTPAKKEAKKAAPKKEAAKEEAQAEQAQA